MDVKYNPPRVQVETGNQGKVAKRKSLFGYVQELKDEMHKVSWTTKEELKLSTKVVIWSTFLFGFAVYIVDLCMKGALALIKTIVHFIFG